MSDLIRREEVLQELADFEVPEDPDGSVYIAWGIGTAMRLTENTPAVDAVEVVRCKDCVNNPRISTKTKGMVWCRKFRSEVRPNDFCSYGERREENAEADDR